MARTNPYRLVQASRPRQERRRYPRYPWPLPTEVKTPHHTVSQGTLLNMGRGGGLLETAETLLQGDLVGLKIGEEADGQSEEIVLLGRTIWGRPDSGGGHRYGLAFFSGQEGSYQRLYRSQEVAHSRAVARDSGLMYVDMMPSVVEKRALGFVSRDLGFSLNCVPIKLRGERLMVAMSEPGNARALEKLQLYSRCKISRVVATPSAIRNTLTQCWGAQYVPSEEDLSEIVSLPQPSLKKKPRILALTSSVPDFGSKGLAVNLAAVFNRDEKRTVIAEPKSKDSIASVGASETTTEPCEFKFLVLPMDKKTLHLDRALRADEAILVVSPSSWQKGCLYLETMFRRFVEIRKHQQPAFLGRTTQLRGLQLSVICAQISEIREGFKTFSRIEARVGQQLDMSEPGFDIRLYYLGGILADEKNTQKAEKMGVPLAVLRPRSPASQCMTHIAQSLLRPTQERDPRIPLTRSLTSRFFG